MCIIAVSKIGVRQPSLAQLRNMFNHNPHGAGYMVARNGYAEIHKGFLNWEDFQRAVKAEHFTAKDAVVYHFRISTQAGVKPEMTHPFPLTSVPASCEKLDIKAPIGIAHNGVIRMTSDYRETRFSDTAIFITRYMSKLIRRKSDITDPEIMTMIDHLTNSKWAIMNGETGEITTIGNFINNHGLLFSNYSYENKPSGLHLTL